MEKAKESFLQFYNTKRKLFYIISGVFLFFILLIIVLLVFLRAPNPPEDLRAEPRSHNSINLTWADPYNSERYNIYRSKEMEEDYEKVGNTSTRHYRDEGLTPETIYYYRVTGLRGERESEYSEDVMVETDAVGPVSNLREEGVSSDYIRIAWDGYEGSEGYIIYRTDNPDRPYRKIAETNNQHYVDSGLTENVTYYYQVTQLIGGSETDHAARSFTTREWLCGEEINYDGKFYETVKIGDQCWFAENLNYETQEGSWCYNDNPEHCDRYGILYSLDTALLGSDKEGAQGICPDNWRVPSDRDFIMMERELGMERIDSNNTGWRGERSKVGDRIKAVGDCTERGADFCGLSGLNVLLGGNRAPAGAFLRMGTHTYLWTSTYNEEDDSSAWSRLFYINNDTVYRETSSTRNGFYVRCMKDI